MRTFNVHKMFIFQSSSVLSVPGLVPCVLCIYILLKSRSDLSNIEICVLCDRLSCICPSVLLVDGLGSAAILVSAVSVPVSHVVEATTILPEFAWRIAIKHKHPSPTIAGNVKKGEDSQLAVGAAMSTQEGGTAQSIKRHSLH